MCRLAICSDGPKKQQGMWSKARVGGSKARVGGSKARVGGSKARVGGSESGKEGENDDVREVAGMEG